MRTYPTTPMCDGPFLALFEPTVRDTDVFVTTAAKCGQTWLQTLLFHLETGGREPDLRGVGLHGVSPWLELPRSFDPDAPIVPHEARLARMEALDDPRVLKMHVVWDEVPRPPGSRARILTVTRDPRDVPYSMFSHLQAMEPGVGPTVPSDFATYFEKWFEFGFYFKFVRSMWAHRDDPDLFWLRYEDMHRDLRKEALRVIAFLGWDVSEDALERSLALVDFSRMRAAEKDTFFPGKGAMRTDRNFFREGAVGKNRRHLTAEQERRILDRTLADLGPECAAFVLDGT